MRIVTVFVLLASTLPVAAKAPVKRVLLIGIDGCRTDALLAADAPNLHGLIRDGATSLKNDVLGERKIGDTLSGPGWTSMLTGVWADKHGVRDNGFLGGPSKYRTFFSRLDPSVPTAALVSWKALHELVFVPGEGCKVILDGSKPGFERADEMVADAAVKLLGEQDPAATFVFFGQVDQAGHQHGFSPRSEKYMRALARVDIHIGQVLRGLGKRPTYAEEDWLIIVATDHGGRNLHHRGGASVDEIRYTFLILKGPSVAKGILKQPTANVDVAYTALTHLGVTIQPEWKLAGRCVGLKVAR